MWNNGKNISIYIGLVFSLIAAVGVFGDLIWSIHDLNDAVHDNSASINEIHQEIHTLITILQDA